MHAVSGHKEHDASLAVYPSLTIISLRSVTHWGPRWRSSPVAGVTNSQDEACRADIDKRRCLICGC